MPDQVRLDPVARRPGRLAGKQRFGRDAQRRLKEVDCSITSQCLVQSLAKTNPGWCSVAHRRCKQFIASQLEEGAMPNPMPCCPLENARRIVLGDPATEQLACLVPIDQKYQRGADSG